MFTCKQNYSPKLQNDFFVTTMVTKHIYSYRHFLKMIAMKNGKQVGIGSTIEFLLGIFRHSSVQVVWKNNIWRLFSIFWRLSLFQRFQLKRFKTHVSYVFLRNILHSWFHFLLIGEKEVHCCAIPPRVFFFFLFYIVVSWLDHDQLTMCLILFNIETVV